MGNCSKFENENAPETTQDEMGVIQNKAVLNTTKSQISVMDCLKVGQTSSKKSNMDTAQVALTEQAIQPSNTFCEIQEICSVSSSVNIATVSSESEAGSLTSAEKTGDS